MALKQFNLLKIITAATVFFLLLWVMLFTALQFAYPMKYEAIVKKYSEKYDVDSALIFSVMKTESGFFKNAVSDKNAIGLMQITSDTAYWIADNIEIDDFILSDPEINIMFSCWYIRYLTDKFGETKTALAAYNAGEGNVSKWLNSSEYSINGRVLDKIPFNETDRYVKTVMSAYNIYNRLY